MFAGDSLLLLKTDEQSAQCLQNILDMYEDCLGQIINKDKSSVMFSGNTTETEKRSLNMTLQIGGETRNEKYLGLPVYMNQSQKLLHT